MDPLVQGTNDSSILSKWSMVRRGYFQDDVIGHFVTKNVRRSPLIHLGYYARAVVMDRHIRLFLESASDGEYPQILSLGAGYDTTFFRITAQYPNLSYFEVDLPDVVSSKISIIANSSELKAMAKHINELQEGSTVLSTKNYTIFTHDLSDTTGLTEKLRSLGFQFERPTLIFSECAITYIDEEQSTNLIRWAAKILPNGTFMNYEQLNPDDGFGQVMTSHFNKIQSPLKSLPVYKTIENQQQRYIKAGWTDCRVTSVMELLRRLLTEAEFSNIFKKEPFDEWEEFHLKCCHYSLAVAIHRPSSLTEFHSVGLLNAQEKAVYVTPMEQLNLERFAHSVGRLSDGSALVVGGFGVSPGHPHGRCGIQHIGLPSKRVCLTPDPDIGSLDCLYHTCTPLRGNEFLLYGGRTSPVRETNFEPLLLTVLNENSTDLNVRVEKISVDNETSPLPRWRHSAVPFNGSVLIFGGRNKDLEVFQDLWELRPTGSGKWKWIEITRVPHQEWPEARFSHAFASDGSSVYLSGGLNDKFQPLNDIWELTKSKGTWRWRQIRSNPSIPLMYSHKMFHVTKKLILLGGVNDSHSVPPALTIVRLTTLAAQTYSLEVNGLSTYLFHNFDAVHDEEDDSIVCYGGGGNCFSFGTHFNTFPLKLSNLADL